MNGQQFCLANLIWKRRRHESITIDWVGPGACGVTACGARRIFVADESRLRGSRSCHLFCQCYFNRHAEHPMCEFNMAVTVREGHSGNVDLANTKYWLTGDLGDK